MSKLQLDPLRAIIRSRIEREPGLNFLAGVDCISLRQKAVQYEIWKDGTVSIVKDGRQATIRVNQEIAAQIARGEYVPALVDLA